MPSIGSTEILLCLVVALIVLGPEQLPKAARQLGRAVAELKRFNAGVQSHLDDIMASEDKSTGSQAERSVDEPATRPAIPDTHGFRLIDGGSAAPKSQEPKDPESLNPDGPGD